MPTSPRDQEMSFRDLIRTYRDEIIERARAKVASRYPSHSTAHELAYGVPLFLTQLESVLSHEGDQSLLSGLEMGMSATKHGGELLEEGFSVAQVVHGYSDLFQAITELALDRRLPVATEDWQTLHQCLDEATASAVTAYCRERALDASAVEAKRQGCFAHELRNRLSAAMLAFQLMKLGKAGVAGSTIAALERNLEGLRDLINGSLTAVRLTMGKQPREALAVVEFLRGVEIEAGLDAAARGLRLQVERGENDVLVEVDRQLFTSAISNLLQNAFKFTRPGTQVCLRTHATADHVMIEVEDQCGGLPPGTAEAIFRPFEQRGSDRSGLGLGLGISRDAIEAHGGTLSVRDIPGKGCVFTVQVPRALVHSLVAP